MAGRKDPGEHLCRRGVWEGRARSVSKVWQTIWGLPWGRGVGVTEDVALTEVVESSAFRRSILELRVADGTSMCVCSEPYR